MLRLVFPVVGRAIVRCELLFCAPLCGGRLAGVIGRACVLTVGIGLLGRAGCLTVLLARLFCPLVGIARLFVTGWTVEAIGRLGALFAGNRPAFLSCKYCFNPPEAPTGIFLVTGTLAAGRLIVGRLITGRLAFVAPGVIRDEGVTCAARTAAAAPIPAATPAPTRPGVRPLLAAPAVRVFVKCWPGSTGAEVRGIVVGKAAR